MMRLNKAKGFLLLEVVVSIVIIAGGLLFVVRSYSTTKKIIDKAAECAVIALLLEEKMFDCTVRGEARDTSTQGEFSSPKGYVWISDVAPVTISGVDMNEIKLTVKRSLPASRATQIFSEEVVTYMRKK